MNDTYVALTGGLDNAGDYLIATRGRRLLQTVRPDRALVEVPSLEPFDDERLAQVNASRALLLLGGPALQRNMVPAVYPLVDDLTRITVPIVPFGIGWKGARGDWATTRDYLLAPRTRELLARIQGQAVPASVRDYHTLNVCLRHGLTNVVMTGCPVTYDPDVVGREPVFRHPPKTLSFSIGRFFTHSASIRQGMLRTLLALRDGFPQLELTAVFHNSTDPERLRRVYAWDRDFGVQTERLLAWLAAEGIRHVDVSGGATRLMEHYAATDLHVGYRVHAHIFMSSLSRPSILLAEDGRGHAVHEVLGGYVLGAFGALHNGLATRVVRKLGGRVDAYTPDLEVATDVVALLRYEIANDYVRTRAVRRTIDVHHARMVAWLERLP